ncbi:MAG: hypothetical protein AB7G48_16325 [Nitrospiraceae bacterium]
MFGLAVLLLCGLYVGLARYMAQRMEVRTQSKLGKYATIAMFVLIPTWDIIPGRLYHQYICQKEGGVEVFKTIEVDKTYFMPDGRLDEKELQKRFDRQTSIVRGFSKVFRITKHQLSILDRQTGDKLGTATQFSYFGGWLHTTILSEAAPDPCPQFSPDPYEKIWQEVFRPKTETNSGGT